MCTDEDDVSNGPKSIWMDVTEESYKHLMQRGDVRGRVVYSFDEVAGGPGQKTKDDAFDGAFDRSAEIARLHGAAAKLVRLGYHYKDSAWVMKVLGLYKITTPPGPNQMHIVVSADNEQVARSKAAVRFSAFEDPTCTCQLLDPNVK